MISSTALTELSPGEEAIVEHLQGGQGIQHRLRTLGIVEGQRVRKLSSLAAGGPVIILVNRAQVAIGRGMARKILVQPL
ncbi:MAG: ferrous iron transport protein A [Spirochaetales bacterium]|nr:ferrous iron transport protein A [Spirochaetales bacterium]